MTKEQEEVLITLFGTIDSKVTIRKKMKKMFEDIGSAEISKVLKEYKKKRKAVSLRNVTYRDKVTIFRALVQKRSIGEIKEIFIFLTTDPSRNTPPDFYKALLGDARLGVERAKLRGQRVRFVDFTPDMLNIIVSLPEKENEHHRFIIQDINCKVCVELQLP